MGTTRAGYEHSAIGAVHEVIVTDAEPSSLASALVHERDTCHAARVVVDLTAVPDLSDGHVELLSDTIEPHDERWAVRISARTPDDTVERLCESGLEGHLITDETVDVPTHVERRSRR